MCSGLLCAYVLIPLCVSASSNEDDNDDNDDDDVSVFLEAFCDYICAS
jgi:hypothetical protein